MVKIGLWVTAWLESVCCGPALGWCFGVWIGTGLVFRWCGLALGLLWWCYGGVGFVVVVLWLFAMVISNSSELTGQHRSVGSHRVRIFTAMPLSYVTQKLKTPIWCFWFYITLTQNF